MYSWNKSLSKDRIIVLDWSFGIIYIEMVGGVRREELELRK